MDKKRVSGFVIQVITEKMDELEDVITNIEKELKDRRLEFQELVEFIEKYEER